MRFGGGMVVPAALAVLCSAGRSAAAEAEALPVDLTFQADAGCPDATTFVDRVNARAPLRAEKAPNALRLSVALQPTEGGFRGRLRAGDAEGSETREVEAASCLEVAEALALIGALIVERTKRENAERPPVARPAAIAPPPAPSTPPPTTRRRTISLGAEGLLTWPLSSAPLSGLSVSLFVDGGLSWWLSAGYAGNDFLASPERLRVRYGALTFGVGPPSLRLASRWRLAAALGAEGGFLAAEGVGVEVPLSVERSYWAVGLLARLEWRVLDRGYLFAHGAGLVPLVERSFSTREPYERVGTTATVAPKAGVGFGFGF